MSNVIFTRDKAETADLKCFLKNELILRITVTEKKFASWMGKGGGAVHVAIVFMAKLKGYSEIDSRFRETPSN